MPAFKQVTFLNTFRTHFGEKLIQHHTDERVFDTKGGGGVGGRGDVLSISGSIFFSKFKKKKTVSDGGVEATPPQSTSSEPAFFCCCVLCERCVVREGQAPPDAWIFQNVVFCSLFFLGFFIQICSHLLRRFLFFSLFFFAVLITSLRTLCTVRRRR